MTSIDPIERRVAAAPAQTISPERAASFVSSDTWLDYGSGLCQPDRFDRALAARVHELSNVKIRHCLTMRPRAVLDADSEGEHLGERHLSKRAVSRIVARLKALFTTWQARNLSGERYAVIDEASFYLLIF